MTARTDTTGIEDEIRELYATGDYTKKQLRKKFELSRTVMNRILPTDSEFFLKLDYKERWVHLRLRTRKARALRRGVPIDKTLTYEDLKPYPICCPIFKDILLSYGDNFSDNSASIDRVNPELGYTQGNIAIISMKANRLKNNMTPDQLRSIADWIDNHNKPKE